MTIENFIKDGIHYIKITYNNGSVNIYPDPDFHVEPPANIYPPLPPLTSTDEKLDFIIDQLNLKSRFSNNSDNNGQ